MIGSLVILKFRNSVVSKNIVTIWLDLLLLVPTEDVWIRVVLVPFQCNVESVVDGAALSFHITALSASEYLWLGLFLMSGSECFLSRVYG